MIQLQPAIDCCGHINFLHKCYSSREIQGIFQQTRVVSRETVRAEIQSQNKTAKYIFIIVHDEQYAGYSYAFRSYTFNHFEIGVTLIPEMRQKGYGFLAHQMLITHMLTVYQAKRLMAYTCIGNMVERSILERCFFVHEGTMRQAGTTYGITHDIVIYGALSEELEAI